MMGWGVQRGGGFVPCLISKPPPRTITDKNHLYTPLQGHCRGICLPFFHRIFQNFPVFTHFHNFSSNFAHFRVVFP